MIEGSAPQRSKVQPCAIVPVYNHPATLAAVVAGLRAHDLPVFVVDDASEHACAATINAVAEAHDSVTVVRRRVNGGKGRAVMDGVRHVRELGYSHALQIDADGQHDSRAIAPALARLRAQPNRLILGQPRFDSSIPRSRRYGRWLTHGMVWLETLSLTIRDGMCGLRIYPLDQLIALADRRPLGARMDFDIEVCVRLYWTGIGIEPVDVRVHYPADGISHFRLWDDNRRIALMHFRLLGGMLVRLPWLIFRKVSTVD